MSLLLQCLYMLCALSLGLYTLGQCVLLWRYWRTCRETPPAPAFHGPWPRVTVQLPLYNEVHVAGRLIDAVAAFDYPRDKLLIQALDDSEDGTTRLVARKLAALEERGYRAQHLRRGAREGFKAGALANGLRHSADDFIAIFDADFVPPPDFLRRALPHLLAEPDIGIVQSRWSHLNADQNSLTRAQRLSIDTHFIVEQAARNRSQWLIPFNGTGGVWRRGCIEAAGGWSADTLTEDLDLSYRAQMAGWRSHFAPEIAAPGEIPPQLAAYKSQQARWATGNTQCLRKLAPALFAAPLSVAQKIMAIQHLCQYLPQPLMLLMLLLTPPLLLLGGLPGVSLAPLGLIGLAPPLMYVASQLRLYADPLPGIRAFPALLFIGTGMSLSNSLAVLGALIGLKTHFRRTPKFEGDWRGSAYALSADHTLWLEAALLLYSLWAAWLAWELQRELCPYLLIFALSFATVVGLSLRDSWNLRRAGSLLVAGEAGLAGD